VLFDIVLAVLAVAVARSSCSGAASDVAVPIANQIRRLRFDHGEMTQAELAERIGMTRQTVAAIEAGKYSPSLEAAFRIAQVFGARLEDGVPVGGLRRR
jgi:putative transcriptional regulator